MKSVCVLKRSISRIYLAVTEEKVGVINTERIVTTEINFKVTKMIEQLQNGNFGGD